MTAEQKSIWVAALRSGTWKQGKGRLKDGDKYCCLGVAQELFGLQGQRDDTNPELYLENTWLPFIVQVELGHRNDGVAGYTRHDFPAIADYIESSVEPTE